MISQSAFSAGAGAGAVGADEVAVGAAAVGASAVAVGAGAVAVADGQGVAGTGIVVEDPADALPAPAGVVPAAAGAEADVADPAAAGLRQGFAGAAALADASSTALTRGVKTAAIPTPSTTARSPIISAGRARGGRPSWLR